MTDLNAMIGAEAAEELYDGDDGATAAGFTRVGTQLIRRSRWYERNYLVLRDSDGAHWGLVYDEGLTEEQEMERPWDGGNYVPLVRLYPHEVVTTVYGTEPAGVSSC